MPRSRIPLTCETATRRAWLARCLGDARRRVAVGAQRLRTIRRAAPRSNRSGPIARPCRAPLAARERARGRGRPPSIRAAGAPPRRSPTGTPPQCRPPREGSAHPRLSARPGGHEVVFGARDRHQPRRVDRADLCREQRAQRGAKWDRPVIVLVVKSNTTFLLREVRWRSTSDAL